MIRTAFLQEDQAGARAFSPGDRLGETMPKMSARMVEDDVQAIMGFPKEH